MWDFFDAVVGSLCEGLELGECKEPMIIDPSLRVEIAVDNLSSPTTMAFLSTNDILVLEKNGSLIRAVNGVKLVEPVHEFDVMKEHKEVGLLGLATSKQEENTYIFIYVTESEQGKFLGNRLYRYSFVDGKLSDEMLLLDFPSYSHRHIGGAIEIGPDSNVYLALGDYDNGSISYDRFHLINQNISNSGGIVRITQDGQPAGILDDMYFAYGIRNSFGLDFDPLTGDLWDTENGNFCCDEINRVEPGFNSGWPPVLGIWNNTEVKDLLEEYVNISTVLNSHEYTIGKYAEPEFVWIRQVAPTDLVFLDSDKLGKEYENDIFVGSAARGQIYHFDLNEERTKLLLEGAVADKVAGNRTDEEFIFGQNFDGISWVTGITDLEVGPDGYLYAVALGHGRIYKIVPETQNS